MTSYGLSPPRLGRQRVLIAYKNLPHYRVDFFEGLRGRLAQQGIELDVAYGQPTGVDLDRRDTADLPWGDYVPNRVWSLGSRELIWQPCLGRARHADLVIVEQASRLLLNYALLLRQVIGLGRVAFWGHGANLQIHRAHSGSELLKRRVSRYPHWWFAYTDGARERIAKLGYPRERITVVQNAIDTSRMREMRATLVAADESRVRQRFGLGTGPVAAFVGGLYEDKRLGFLMRAADEIVRSRPEFKLLIIGDGPQREDVLRWANERPHVAYAGPLFGRDKVEALAVASMMLIPGLVGLAVLDAFALELPLVTTAVDYHSPEIEYLVDGENGIVVDRPDDVDAYSASALDVLTDPALLARLRRGCREAATRYTNQEMVGRFSTGVMAALAAQGKKA